MWFCKIFKLFMVPARLSILKFLGTISLGILTGISYSLTTLTLPPLLTLSPGTSTHALTLLEVPTQRTIRRFSRLSTGFFLIAYISSPAHLRHPYLIYTSLLASAAGASEILAPMLLGETPIPAKKTAATQDMEASYDDLGQSLASQSEQDDTSAKLEAKARAESFTKARVVEVALSGVGFVMAVLGIWGDGAVVV